jgi:hypothetical protein
MSYREENGADEMATKKHMTVQQAIDFLSKIEDKSMAMMIDCPYCGNQLDMLDEVVLLRSAGTEE